MSRRAPRARTPEQRLRRDVRRGLLVLAVVVAIAVLATISTNGVPGTSGMTVGAELPPSAPALRAGVEVRIAGRAAGVVRGVRTRPDGGQAVELSLREGDVGRDARLAVRMRSPAGQQYLALDPGRASAADGPVRIPRARVTVAEDLVTVIEGIDRRTLDRAAAAARLAGTAVAGRGAGLRPALRGLDRTLADTTTVLRALRSGDDVARLARTGGGTLDALAGRAARDDAGALVRDGATALDALGSDRADLDGLLAALPPAQRRLDAVGPRLNRFLVRATRTTRALTPTVGALRSALPATGRMLATTPALRRELAALRRTAVPALTTLAPALPRLGPVGDLLDRALPPLAGLAGYLSRYPREFEAGFTGYYVAALYQPPIGLGKGNPIAPAMTVLTCASRTNPDPRPGDFLQDRLGRPCR